MKAVKVVGVVAGALVGALALLSVALYALDVLYGPFDEDFEHGGGY